MLFRSDGDDDHGVPAEYTNDDDSTDSSDDNLAPRRPPWPAECKVREMNSYYWAVKKRSGRAIRPIFCVLPAEVFS